MPKFTEYIFSVTNTGIHKQICIFGIKFKFKNKQKVLLAKFDTLENLIKLQNKSLQTAEKERTKVISNIEKKFDDLKNETAKLNEGMSAQNNKINHFKNLYIDATARITPKPYLTHFVVDITSHCNLNCRGCDHFSPLAEEKFYDLNQFKKDMERLSVLTSGNVNRICIMGGEPLLNKNVLEYLKITRNCFKDTKIKLVTNGILLDKQTEEFWNTLHELHIFVEYTKYPLNLDYDKFDEIIKKHKVPIDVVGHNMNVVKTSYKIPLDINGNQNVMKNFLKCFHANDCITLKNGKMYTCTVAPNIEHFNKYFGYNIPLTDNDGIDIYKVQNVNEILEFLAKPIPFCKYCNVNGRTFKHEWGISKKEISEWI